MFYFSERIKLLGSSKKVFRGRKKNIFQNQNVKSAPLGFPRLHCFCLFGVFERKLFLAAFVVVVNAATNYTNIKHCYIL
jgi:hypothetical protein